MATVRDTLLLDATDPALARPVPAGLAAARADILVAAATLLTIPDGMLGQPWPWIGGSEEEIRYGAYRAGELLEAAETRARQLLASAEADERQAARIVAPATAARWDLHGLLVGLDEAHLDADPGGGEWTIRQTMGHVIGGQRAYGWGTAWWLRQAYPNGSPDTPQWIPDGELDGLPDEAEEAPGSVAEIRARFDAITDLATERLAGLPDDRLELAARWSGFAVTIGFRLGRWSSHIREHTIQVEKTLVMLGIVPGESWRLARHLLAAYGRTEAAVFARRPQDEAIDTVAAAAVDSRRAIEAAAQVAHRTTDSAGHAPGPA